MVRSCGKLAVALLLVSVVGWAEWVVAQNSDTDRSTLEWQPTLEDAQRVAAQSDRLVLVHFWAPWCESCGVLEREVFAQPHVQQAVHERFVPVKLNVDDFPTTAKRYGIDRIPTDLMISPKGEIIGRMQCPTKPDAYVERLTATAAGPSTNSPSISSTAVSSPAVAAQSAPASPPANESTNPSPPPSAKNAAPPAVPAYSDDRYAEFFTRYGGAASNSEVTSNGAASNAAPSNAVASSAATPATSPLTPAQQPTTTTGGMANAAGGSSVGRYAPQPYHGAASPVSPLAAAPGTSAAPTASNTPNPPAGTSPFGLEGYCPVTLAEQKRWQVGDRRWGVVHRGRTYLFAGPGEQRQFLANPDRYSPAISGQDVVLALDRGQKVEGQRQFGIQYQGRTYLFSSPATRQTFVQNAQRYATEVLQAESPTRGTLR